MRTSDGDAKSTSRQKYSVLDVENAYRPRQVAHQLPEEREAATSHAGARAIQQAGARPLHGAIVYGTRMPAAMLGVNVSARPR
jgi:hypothetical protein